MNLKYAMVLIGGKNDIRVFLEDVYKRQITDSLEGIQLAEGQSFDLGILEAGKAKTVTYTYQVKESDLGKSILNTATATGDVPENPADTPKPEGKDEKMCIRDSRNSTCLRN